jgi:hypothetical protein
MNKEKLIIFALVAFVSYHLFIKEGFEVQKTRCQLNVIPGTCDENTYASSKGCKLNQNRTDANPDYCICADPSKGCEVKTTKSASQTKTEILKRMLEIQEAKLAPIRNASDNFFKTRADWQNEKDATLKKAKETALEQSYNTYVFLKPGAPRGGLPNDIDVIIASQGVQKDGKFKFAGNRRELFQVLGNEYKDLYTKYVSMVRLG